ncbi:hypothetical protein [Methyloceanibacter sp.]|uniref:hypothetical protein n=1 Tax=Methyloceanibacter sp. TaxID=1965321 RepID=UPI003D6D769B
MGTSNPHQCIESFKDALRRAGLEERRADISPGVMAHRLRPRLPAKPNQLPRVARRVTAFERVRRNFSTSFWILILAFALGLAPALAIGAFAWAAKSKAGSASSCSSWMAESLAPTAPVVGSERPHNDDLDASVTET